MFNVNISLTQASFSEFAINGHYYTSPNSQKPPPTISESFSYSDSLPEPVSPPELRKRVWAYHNHPYLPFVLNSPFHGAMTSRFATPEQIPLEEDTGGHHLPTNVAKSWKTLEHSCRAAAAALISVFQRNNPKVSLICSIPTNPSEFGYFIAHSSKEKARSALYKSIDAFVILFAYLSFCIAISRTSNDPASASLSDRKPIWLQVLSDRKLKLHPEWLQLLADSPIADFTTGPQRLGAIVNVARCSWLHLVPYMLRANVPVWLYWGVPPAFAQPLIPGALDFAPRSHPLSKAPASSEINVSQPVGPRVPSGHGGSGQLLGETWKEFMTRQNLRRKAKLQKENSEHRRMRESREMSSAKKSCPGKKGPSVFVWEVDGGVWTRSLITRGQVEGYWDSYRSSQKIFNSIDNCWDLCEEFDEGTAGEVEDDSDDDDVYPNRRKQVPGHLQPQPPTPILSEIGTSGDVPDCPSMVVDPPRNLEVPIPPSVSTPAQVAASSHDLPHRDDSDCMLVDSSHDLGAPTPPLPAQVAALSHDLLHPNPRDASDFPSMPVDSPRDLVAPTPLTQVTASSHDPPPSNSQSMSVDSPRDLAAPTPPTASTPAQIVTSSRDLVDSPCDLVAPTPPAQVAVLSCDPLHPNSQFEGNFVSADEDDEDDPSPYDASKQDVLNAYKFVALDLEKMPITTFEDFVYYRYGFSLNENLYTGIPASFKGEKRDFRSEFEVCRAVGGQNLDTSGADLTAIEDFLSILAAGISFKDVPGKYWDLSPLGRNPIVNLTRVFISIEVKQLTNLEECHYIIRPRFLHPSRDTPWAVSVDPMTALECIRRGLGPHTIDIANFLITHGVRFRAIQPISESESQHSPTLPNRLPCRYLGHRPDEYSFDLADFAGYEALRDSFLRSQPHGPLALREGGIIARLAREVLPYSNGLSGPSSEALSRSGHHAQFVCNDQIYVEDEFSEDELGLICGTYVISTKTKGGENIFSFN